MVLTIMRKTKKKKKISQWTHSCRKNLVLLVRESTVKYLLFFIYIKGS